MLTTLIGQTLDGKYYLDKLLGQGGMGAVFLATHLGTKRPVALKVIAPQFMANEEVGERFRREAEAAGRLRHPNVVNVTDFGVTEVGDNQFAYLVMEYLDGASLGDLLKKQGKLPLPFVVDIVEQICLAIGNAHQLGIIHRDLKPDNIWLQPDGRGGHIIKVLDFGLAKLRDTSADDQAINSAPPDLPARPAPIGSSHTVGAGLATQAPYTDDAETQLHLASTEPDAATQIQAAVPAEAATLIQSPAGLPEGEDQTLMQPATVAEEKTRLVAIEDEAATQVQLAAASEHPEEDVTRIQPATAATGDSAATRSRPALQTSSNRSAATRGAAGNSLSSHGSSTVELTTFGSILGTPLYMSPEQCRGESLDARSDIYSLGIIVYQMLAGELPFTGNMTELINQHSTAEPPALKEKCDTIPASLAALVMTALAKRPEERPTTAEAFAKAFRVRAEDETEILKQAKAVVYSSQGLFFSVLAPLYVCFAAVSLVINFAFNSLLSTKTVAALIFYLLVYLSMTVATKFSMAINVLTIHTLRTNPSGKITGRAILRMFLKRLPALLRTILQSYVGLIIGLLQFILPAFRRYVNYGLLPGVVVLEGASGTSAIERSQTLVKPLRAVTRAFLGRDFGITLLSAIAIAFSMGVTTLIFGGNRWDVLSMVMVPGIRTMIVTYCWFLLTMVHGVYAAMPLAMLYFKARQANGEAVAEAGSKDWQGSKKKRPDTMGKATMFWLGLPSAMLAIMIFFGVVNFGTESLIDATRRGRLATVRRLLAQGVKVDETGMRGNTALMYAADEGFTDIIKDLLAAGAKPNKPDTDGDTPLIYAAFNNRPEALKMLLAAGAELNARNASGETALVGAALRGHTPVVKELLAAGANPAVKDKKGKTALAYAEEEGHKEIAEMLKAAGATE